MSKFLESCVVQEYETRNNIFLQEQGEMRTIKIQFSNEIVKITNYLIKNAISELSTELHNEPQYITLCENHKLQTQEQICREKYVYGEYVVREFIELRKIYETVYMKEYEDRFNIEIGEQMEREFLNQQIKEYTKLCIDKIDLKFIQTYTGKQLDLTIKLMKSQHELEKHMEKDNTVNCCVS